jgi:hypothetical protein
LLLLRDYLLKFNVMGNIVSTILRVYGWAGGKENGKSFTGPQKDGGGRIRKAGVYGSAAR